MKICIVVGARPNFIKVAPLVRAIERSNKSTYSIVYTGSESDPTLEASLFSDLQMPRPDVFLGVTSASLNDITAQVMARFDQYLEQNPAQTVIVVDDLASTMAAAIVAKRRSLCVAHLVAGTRSFDIQMPKEINRLVIDALSDYLFTAGLRSNSVATHESADSSHTYMVGNLLMDTLRFNRDRLQQPPLSLADRGYIVLTLNRKALLHDHAKLTRLLSALTSSAGGTPVIAPLRGTAREVVEALPLPKNALTMVDPLPYLQFGWLTAHALGIITDSGNVAEEATFNGVPCITLNSYTEHQETVTVGTNVLVGEDPDRLASETRRMVAHQWKQGALPDRWDGRTAERIVGVLEN